MILLFEYSSIRSDPYLLDIADCTPNVCLRQQSRDSNNTEVRVLVLVHCTYPQHGLSVYEVSNS